MLAAFRSDNIPDAVLGRLVRIQLTQRMFVDLENEKVPESVLVKLNPLKYMEFSRDDFEAEIKKLLNATEKKRFQRLILNQAEKHNPLKNHEFSWRDFCHEIDLALDNGKPRLLKITDQVVAAIRQEGRVPETVLERLDSLKNDEMGFEDFLPKIETILRDDGRENDQSFLLGSYQNSILNQAYRACEMTKYRNLILSHYSPPNDDKEPDLPPRWKNLEPFEAFISCLEKVEEDQGKLCKIFRKLEGWWIADHPSALNPKYTSVVETLAYSFDGLLYSIEHNPRSRYLGTLCRFLDLKYNPLDLKSFSPLLRCEIAAMSRRQPPTEDMCNLTAEINRRLRSSMGWQRSWSTLNSRVQNSSDLLKNWRNKSEAERDAAIDSIWLANPKEKPLRDSLDNSGAQHKPNWNNHTLTLEYGGKKIHTYEDGPGRPANKQWAILQAFQEADWQEEIGFRLNGTGVTNDTIYQLNDTLGNSPIRFHCVRGRGIKWSRIQRGASQDKKRQLSVNKPSEYLDKNN